MLSLTELSDKRKKATDLPQYRYFVAGLQGIASFRSNKVVTLPLLWRGTAPGVKFLQTYYQSRCRNLAFQMK